MDSLVDEWENSYGEASRRERNGRAGSQAFRAPSGMEAVAADRRALRVLVRNAMFRRVQLMALEDSQALGKWMKLRI